MTPARIESMCPFFIVTGVPRSIAFYQERLGFETRFREPGEAPFFGIVGRDNAMLFLKAGEAAPLPNPVRDPAMRWDAYCYTPDPDAAGRRIRGARRPVQQPAQGHGRRSARLRDH